MSRIERHAAEEAAVKDNIDRSGDAVSTEVSTGRKRKKKELTPLGRFLDVTGTVILIVTILLCLGLAVPRFAGIDSYVVVSGSMEPAIPVGSMVYSKPVDPATLQPGDIIVFYNTDQKDSVPVTHRVVENHTEAGEIITKGDANSQADIFPASYYNIGGKVVAHIPKLGLPASLLATTAGKIAVAMVILAGYLLTEVGGRLRKQ